MDRRATAAALLGLALASGCAAPSPSLPTERGRAATSASSPRPPEEAPLASASAPASTEPAPATPYLPSEPLTLLVRGGSVLDGTGGPGVPADVAVRGDRIVHVGLVDERARAERVIDARGLAVTPGFVDAHAHTDPLGRVDHLLAMGVTTVVVGQDGDSPDERIGAYLARVDAARPRVNVASLVGHATVRAAAGLGARPASVDGLERMRIAVARALDEGAFGLSTGLEYVPGAAADAAELAAIADPVGARGAVVMSHLRSEDDDRIDASIEELLAQCRASGASAHVAHLKIVLGRGEARGRALLERLERARASGLRVTADLYPYTASYTTVGILFPEFAKPPNAYRTAVTKRRKDLLEHLRTRVAARNGPEAMVFGTGELAGLTLAEAARRERRPFEEVLAELGPSGGSAAYFVMDDEVVTALFRDPFVMVGTDGSATSAHPRGHGAFARVVAELVRKRRAVSLAEAVRRMTSLPAETLGLEDRGVLRAGAFADLVVLDPETFADRATFEAPQRRAEGVRAVVVGGEVELASGKPEAGRGGRALRSKPLRAP